MNQSHLGIHGIGFLAFDVWGSGSQFWSTTMAVASLMLTWALASVLMVVALGLNWYQAAALVLSVYLAVSAATSPKGSN